MFFVRNMNELGIGGRLRARVDEMRDEMAVDVAQTLLLSQREKRKRDPDDVGSAPDPSQVSDLGWRDK